MLVKPNEWRNLPHLVSLRHNQSGKRTGES